MNEKDIKKIGKQETSLIVKSINSLLGIVSGIVSDGDLNELELRYLKIWCDENKHIADQYPETSFLEEFMKYSLIMLLRKKNEHIYFQN